MALVVAVVDVAVVVAAEEVVVIEVAGVEIREMNNGEAIITDQMAAVEDMEILEWEEDMALAVVVVDMEVVQVVTIQILVEPGKVAVVLLKVGVTIIQLGATKEVAVIVGEVHNNLVTTGVQIKVMVVVVAR